MTTKHTHPVVFGRRVADCPRCTELTLGAPAVQWRGYSERKHQADTLAAIRAHNCAVSRCGPVCTAFDW